MQIDFCLVQSCGIETKYFCARFAKNETHKNRESAEIIQCVTLLISIFREIPQYKIKFLLLGFFPSFGCFLGAQTKAEKLGEVDHVDDCLRG